MNIKRIDHIVIPVSNMDEALAFYRDALGFACQGMSEGGAVATLSAGDQVIKLETTDRPSTLIAYQPIPGSIDMCFEVEETACEVVERLDACGIDIVAGPVEKQGSRGAMTSVYMRDPDGGLIELSSYAEDGR